MEHSRLPDGRDYDAPGPAFLSVAEFRGCTQFTDCRGDVVPSLIERVGGYRSEGGVTELTDILFGDGDSNRCVFHLASGDYDVWSITDNPSRRNTGKTMYFSMIALSGVEPLSWERYSHRYGSDAYNMTIVTPACRRRITQIIEASTREWNLVSEIILGYDEAKYQQFEALGFRTSKPDGHGAEVVFMRTMKVGRLYLGRNAVGDIVAIQGRWL